jgi:hypothetical protein
VQESACAVAFGCRRWRGEMKNEENAESVVYEIFAGLRRRKRQTLRARARIFL